MKTYFTAGILFIYLLLFGCTSLMSAAASNDMGGMEGMPCHQQTSDAPVNCCLNTLLALNNEAAAPLHFEMEDAEQGEVDYYLAYRSEEKTNTCICSNYQPPLDKNFLQQHKTTVLRR